MRQPGATRSRGPGAGPPAALLSSGQTLWIFAHCGHPGAAEHAEAHQTRAWGRAALARGSEQTPAQQVEGESGGESHRRGAHQRMATDGRSASREPPLCCRPCGRGRRRGLSVMRRCRRCAGLRFRRRRRAMRLPRGGGWAPCRAFCRRLPLPRIGLTRRPRLPSGGLRVEAMRRRRLAALLGIQTQLGAFGRHRHDLVVPAAMHGLPG